MRLCSPLRLIGSCLRLLFVCAWAEGRQLAEETVHGELKQHETVESACQCNAMTAGSRTAMGHANRLKRSQLPMLIGRARHCYCPLTARVPLNRCPRVCAPRGLPAQPAEGLAAAAQHQVAAAGQDGGCCMERTQFTACYVFNGDASLLCSSAPIIPEFSGIFRATSRALSSATS